MNPHNDMTVPSGSLAFLDSETPRPDAGRPVRVWLVDDNCGFRGLLAGMLAAVSGFDCSREFPSAEAVLEALAKETPPDVILLDNQMPGQDGVDAVRPIKALAASTRVLMLTTCFDSVLRQRVLGEGAEDFLQKSFTVETISQRIQAALARPMVGGGVPVLAEQKTGNRFDPGTSFDRNRHSGRRAEWACASGRLLRGAFQVRSWLALFF